MTDNPGRAAGHASDVATARDIISRYAYGMDVKDWDYATRSYADEADVDYREVGAMQARMTRSEIGDFLRGLLGDPDLRVHTAISQVIGHPEEARRFVAYYSVRHYRGEIGTARRFILFGWYDFRLDVDDRITSVTVSVSATEGDPAVLG